MLIYPDSISGIATLQPSAKWLQRGLVLVMFGGKSVWSAQQGKRPLSQTGGPKVIGSKWGPAIGFGSTAGSGTTDRLDGGTLAPPASGWRSVVVHMHAISSGGGGLGRVYQDVSGTGGTSGETLYIGSGKVEYLLYATGTIGDWSTFASVTTGAWSSIGITHDRRTVAVNPVMYLNGASTSVLTNASVSGTYGTATISLSFGNRASDGARNFDGWLGPILFFDGALTADEHASLARDPLQVFSPDELFVWIPDSAGGDASASLTGSAGTSSAGTVAPSISASISGVYATSAVGSLSPSTGATASISGATSTASVGSLSPEVSRAIAGSQISTVTGALSAALSKALTGSAATTSAGTLSPTVGATATLSGTASTTATGALAATLSITLGGTSATTSAGILSLPGSYSAALSASQTTSSAGAVSPSVSKAIVGAQSTTAVGMPSATTGATASLSGVQASSATGALSKSVATAVSGCQSTTFAGALGKIAQVSGQEATTSVGTLNASSEPFVVTEVLATRTVFVKPKRSTDITVREKQKSVTAMWS